MQWPNPLIEAELLKRYKRFLADVRFSDGEQAMTDPVVSHVANTGSLRSCLFPPQKCWVSRNLNPKAKLKYSLQAVQVPGGTWVGVNTALPNKLVAEAFQKRVIPWWQEFDDCKSEVVVSEGTRLDFSMTDSKSQKKHFVEVKNVSLADGDLALFPDAKTTRGLKHIHELLKLMQDRVTVEIVFTVQRQDVTRFSPAKDIDPAYAQALHTAVKAGLRISPLLVEMGLGKIELTSKLLKVEW